MIIFDYMRNNPTIINKMFEETNIWFMKLNDLEQSELL